MPSDVTTRVGLDGNHPVLRKTASSGAGRNRLQREAAILARVRHPGVAELLTFDDTAEGATLTLRWAGSPALRGLAPMPPDEAAGTMAALAATVADLHQVGLAHTRIDADHVVLAADGRPVLCGLAEASDAVNRQTDDVKALGQLLTALVGTDLELEPIPDRKRFHLRRERWTGYRRRALLNLADQATADQHEHRPTARELAASLATTVPNAHLAVPDADDQPRPGTDLTTHTPATTLTDRMLAAARSGTEPAESADGPAALAETLPGPSTPDTSTTPDTSMRVATTPGASGPDSAATSSRTDGPLTLDDERWEALWNTAHATTDDQLIVPLALPETTDVPETTVADAEPAGGAHLHRRPVRAPIRVAAAVAGAGLLAAGWMGLRENKGASADRPSASHASAAAARPTVRGSCPVVRGPSADLDHDGCADAVHVRGRVITAGTSQFEVGQPGDEVVLGDWRCSGQVTPALLRPSTGEVFVFPRWSDGTAPLTVTATQQTTGADGIRAEHRGRCDVLLVTRPGKQPVEIPVEPT